MSIPKLVLDNGQGVPKLQILVDNKEFCRIYFCKDGGIIQTAAGAKINSAIGTKLGCRNKINQTKHEDAKLYDGIEIN